jgi:hypothetical protein
MTSTESQQEQAKYKAGDRLYFRPLADRAPFGTAIREGLVTVTQVVDHGSATPYSPRFTYVVRALDDSGTQGTDDRELTEPAAEPGKCPGCGRGFRGARGLRAHQAGRFVTAACRPAPRPEPATWESITSPLDRRTVVWWRGTWPGCGPAYLSVKRRGDTYVWAVRRRPGAEHIAAEGSALTMATARAQAERARGAVADIPATIDRMTMTNHERAKAANAALTPEQRSAAGKARAAQLHHPVTLARRIGAKWPELSDEDRKAVRRELRAAGVIA